MQKAEQLIRYPASSRNGRKQDLAAMPAPVRDGHEKETSGRQRVEYVEGNIRNFSMYAMHHPALVMVLAIVILFGISVVFPVMLYKVLSILF